MKQEEIKVHIKRINMLENNKETLSSLIWGQCLNALKEIIKGDIDYMAQNLNSTDSELLQRTFFKIRN
jgi:conjugal transfer/entry exclusion protein